MNELTSVRQAALEGIAEGEYTMEQQRFMRQVVSAAHDYAGDAYEMAEGDMFTSIARCLMLDQIVRQFCDDFITSVDDDVVINPEALARELARAVAVMAEAR